MKSIWTCACHCLEVELDSDKAFGAMKSFFVEADNKAEAKKAILRNLKAEGLKPRQEVNPREVVIENKSTPLNEEEMSFEELYEIWEYERCRFNGYFEIEILDRIISDETIEKFIAEVSKAIKPKNGPEPNEKLKNVWRKQIKELRQLK